MKEQVARPKFATLQYDVLKELGISVAEYFYLDMMYYLSRDGWCCKSLEAIADDMNITKNGVVKLRDRVIEKGLLNKDRRGRVRTSVTYNKVYLQDDSRTTKLHKRTTLYNSAVQLSGTKNNNENNNRNRDVNFEGSESHTQNPRDHEKARTASEKVRRQLIDKWGLKVKSHA